MKKTLAILTALALLICALPFGAMAQEIPNDSGLEPIVLTIGIQSGNCTFGDGQHMEFSVMREIARQTGVTLQFITYDQEKFRVLMAGGDLPDIFAVETNSGDQVGTLIESGALLPLDDLLNEYGQNIQAHIPVALEWAKNVVGNGQTYILPTNTNTAATSDMKSQGWVGFFSRYDIYKAIGAPAINGEDEYLAVLKQMQDYQRETTGNSQIYALGAWSDWGLWPYWVSYPFSFGYESSNSNHLVNLATGEVEHQYLAEDGVFWKSLAFFNKAYRMGIMDPEGLTMKYDQYCTKISNGTLLTSGVNWTLPDNDLCGEHALNTLLPGAFPVVSELYTLSSQVGYRQGGSRAINAKCKYPERAMQLLNWFDSELGARTLANGVKGEDWDVIDGVPQIIGDRLQAYKDDAINAYEAEHPTGIAGDNFVTLNQFFTSGSFDMSDGEPINLTSSKYFRAQMPVAARYQQFIEDFDATLTSPGEVYQLWIEQGLATSPCQYPLAVELMSAISTSSQQVESKAEAYMSGNIAKIIMAKDDAEFAKVKENIIQDIKAMGVEASDAEYMQLYAESKAQAEALSK